MNELKIGVIGSGGRGKLAAHAHLPDQGSRVVACCDISQETLRKNRVPLIRFGMTSKMEMDRISVGNLRITTSIMSGARLAQVYKQRTKREYALFLKQLSLKYPTAQTIHLVQDNLNTHCKSALYETFTPQEAFALAQRFEFHFTPKSASWLNMIEIEFSALSRQCLNRRVPCIEQLEHEVLTLVKQREDKALKINWQFSIQKARNTFKKQYDQIYKIT